jgi:hypothetical protein
MTTKLSERLRELRDEHAPAEGRIVLREAIDKLIAQAEAQEKLAYFEARVKPSSDDPEAQAGELSDEEIERLCQSAFPVPDPATSMPSDSRMASAHWGMSNGLKVARDNGYLRPSQAIGEQTPVAWHGPGEFPPDPIPEGHMLIGYSTRKARDQEYGLRRLACYAPKGPWTDGYGSVPNPSWWTIIPIPENDESRWYMPARSPMSSEAISALETVIELWRDELVNEGYDTSTNFDKATQALSALRGE